MSYARRHSRSGILKIFLVFRSLIRTFAPMIVANMNLHEVYDTLMEEMPKLDWKRDVLRSKAIKEMNRRMSFQNYVMYDYKVPSSNNQYIIYFYREHPFGPILSGYLCVLFDGSKRFIIKWTDWRSPAIHVFTSHFLQRYKERFLKQPEMTANEVAVRFLARNSEMKPMAVDERINKHIEKYGEFAGEGFLVPDGFCFKLSGKEYLDGKASVGISFFTTFMPLSDMSKSQQEAIFEECMKDLDNLES